MRKSTSLISAGNQHIGALPLVKSSRLPNGINQEVSNVATQSNGSTAVSPTIQQRKINSSIAIQSGEAIVLGGLIRDSKTNSNSGIPFLSSLPKVGEAFKTTDNETERTELVVIISPKVVWDRSDARDVTDDLRSKMQTVFGR